MEETENPHPILAEKIYHSTNLSQAWQVMSYGGIIPVDDGYSVEVVVLPNGFKSVRILFTPKGYTRPNKLQVVKRAEKKEKLQSNLIDNGEELW